MTERISESSVQEAIAILQSLSGAQEIGFELQDGVRFVLFCVNADGIAEQAIHSRHSKRIFPEFDRLFPAPAGESAWQVNFYGKTGEIVGTCIGGLGAP